MLQEEVSGLRGEMALLKGQVEQYTQDVEQLKATDDDMLAYEVETTARTRLPKNIISVAASIDEVYDEVAYALGSWGKDCREGQKTDTLTGGIDTKDFDASYRNRCETYATTVLDNVREAFSSIIGNRVISDENIDNDAMPYSERDAKRVDRLSQTFHELMQDVREHDEYIEERFDTSVVSTTEKEYGKVPGLTYDV